MRYIPETIKQKGLQKHFAELEPPVDYDKFTELMEDGASDTYAGKKLGYSRHSVAKWRKVYKYEKKKEADNAAIESLRNV